MKKMMKKRGMSAILAMVMTVSVLLAAALKTEAAADGTTITLGAGALTAGNKVYFGDQILWRVLHVGSYNELPVCGDGKALLISNDTLDNIHFNEVNDASPSLNLNLNNWAGSNAQTWCVDYYNSDKLTDPEKSAILATSVTETKNYTSKVIGTHGGNVYGPASLSAEHFFFLSAQEADTLFAGDSDREASVWWWLRSPLADSNIVGGMVGKDGWVYWISITDTKYYGGARPAFNLDLSSVLFSSSIPSESSTYKLTLKDTNLKIAVTNDAAMTWSGSTATIPYTISGSSATDQTKAYVLVTDKAYTESGAAVLQYAELGTGKSGTGTFALDTSKASGTQGKDYQIYLVAVNESGDNKKSDYASTPVILPYELRYDANGGTKTMASQNVFEGETYTFPECGFTAPKGKTFDHWEMSGVDSRINVDSNNTPVNGIFKPGSTVKIASNCVQNGVITVTANWKEAPPATVKTAPQAKSLSYIGSAQELVAAGTAEGGTMQYALGKDATTAPTDGWSTSIPTGINAGTYYVWYYVAGDQDHSDTSPIPIPVTISPNGSLLVYNGSAQALVTTGEATGGTMQYALGTDATTKPDASAYTASIPTGTNAGTYYVWYKVSGDQNHNDSEPKCVEATIAKKELKITADAKSKTAGEADPALTYTAEGLVGSDSISGALSREEGEAVGTYQITQGTLSAGDNYTITYTPAVLTINKAIDPEPEPSPEPVTPSGGGGGYYYGGGAVQNRPREPYGDVIGASVTSCRNSSPERIHNMELACEKLNGIILQPGETFSFNETVGPFTAEAGFVLAPVDPDDETTALMGGGVSQVASTLYAGSLFSLLETVERTNHPFPVSFTQPGTDALVTNADDGGLDLKFRNTRSEPIRIVATCTVDAATNIPEIRIGIQSALTASDYMPILFDNTWAGDRNAFLTETPYDPTRPGYRILLTHEEQAFTDDKGAGIRTLTHRKILDAAGMLVRDEILNSKLPDGSYAMDTYYLG